MPPKRVPEAVKSNEECILLYGKHNNVIKWKEHMQTIITELYGIIGMFFTTNQRYKLPRVSYRDYPVDSSSESESSESEVEEEGVEAPALSAEMIATIAADKAVRATARGVRNDRKRKIAERARAKFREDDYIQRKKDLKAQKEHERTVYPMMWKRMSPASQSRVREEEDFEQAFMTLDCVLLWSLIRKTHLTHIFGDSDPMNDVNMHEQENKYNSLRQGEREYISNFKVRFDEQVSANDGVGVTPISESRRALDFIMKLDPRRYKKMHDEMKNDALRCVPDAYPKTLAGAYRVASQWTGSDHSPHASAAAKPAAFVTEGALVATEDSEKVSGKTGGGRKKTPLNEVTCHVCGHTGHYARNCSKRKSSTDKAHVTTTDADDVDSDGYDVALITTLESCMFSQYDVLLDNEASLNIFSNGDLLTGLRKSDKTINVGGIQLGKGVTVNMEGDFGELGRVFYSAAASANVLSFASQVDSGAAVRYDHTGDYFTLQPRNSSSVHRFSRKDIPGSEGRFYSCDWREVIKESAMVATVENNAKAFTKREIGQARKARELLARMGFPTVGHAIAILNSGSNFEVTARDFQIADAIWGADIASLKGKTTKKATPVADITVNAKIVQQDQVLAIDIMFVDKTSTLIGIATPLGLTIAYSLNNLDMNKASRAAGNIKKGIDHFVTTLASQNFKTKMIMSDGERGVTSLIPQLEAMGIEVDISGAGGHVARVERRIRVIKERLRSHVAYHLPFTLSSMGIAMCILYCVSRLNYEPYGVREWGPSPREAFIGRKVDGKKDFRCSFGDYAQCTVPTTDSTMKGRTEDCVVMLPLGNRTGTVRMLSLTTGRFVNRDQFRILPMPLSVIQRMNDLALKDGRVKGKGELAQKPTTYKMQSDVGSSLPDIMESVTNNGIDPSIILENDEVTRELANNEEVGREPEGNRGVDDITPEGEHEGNGGADDVEMQINDTDYADDAIPIFIPQGKPKEVNMDDLIHSFGGLGSGKYDDETIGGIGEEDDATTGAAVGGNDTGALLDVSSETEDTQHVEPLHRRRLDIMQLFRKGVNGGALLTRLYIEPGEDWGEHVFNISVKEALRTRGKDAERVIEKELGQMITKKVWTPVDIKSLPYEEKRRIIRSSMFLKEKFLASGEFEKLKARLVAGGDQQDKSLYDDLSAPTVGTSSVFTILSIAAHERRGVAVIDIGGAFLHADMSKGIPVHMRLDKNMSGMMTKLAPEYEQYADARGCVVVKLDKALYGCVESAALWYENLRVSFSDLGYTPNPYDICVFNRRNEQGVQCTVAIHVDDLLITSACTLMIEDLAAGLVKRYGEITRKNGPVVNYLGMVFDLTTLGEARVTMTGFVDEMLKECGIIGKARTPATEGLFDVRLDVETVTEQQRVTFHRCVAKLLYLAERARPDCLTAVSFLATRVNKCTTDDLIKLQRLLRYVNDTKERGVVFSPGGSGIEVSVLIEAAYGVHPDGKSHTGSCVIIGDVGAVHCKSAKQQIVTKSSTEAELVALSDSANQSLHIRNFVLAQGHSCGPVTIYQDNMSCMALIDRGRSTAERTRHIAIRYFWVKERVDTGEARVQHLGTKKMYANLLTKPLQGAQFQEERKGITGWSNAVMIQT